MLYYIKDNKDELKNLEHSSKTSLQKDLEKLSKSELITILSNIAYNNPKIKRELKMTFSTDDKELIKYIRAMLKDSSPDGYDYFNEDERENTIGAIEELTIGKSLSFIIDVYNILIKDEGKLHNYGMYRYGSPVYEDLISTFANIISSADEQSDKLFTKIYNFATKDLEPIEPYYAIQLLKALVPWCKYQKRRNLLMDFAQSTNGSFYDKSKQVMEYELLYNWEGKQEANEFLYNNLSNKTIENIVIINPIDFLRRHFDE